MIFYPVSMGRWWPYTTALPSVRGRPVGKEKVRPPDSSESLVVSDVAGTIRQRQKDSCASRYCLDTPPVRESVSWPHGRGRRVSVSPKAFTEDTACQQLIPTGCRWAVVSVAWGREGLR